MILDGNDATGIFEIRNGFEVTIEGVTITRGNADGGGGVDNQGLLTLTNVTLLDNNSINAGGGGISNRITGNITLRNSTLAGNSADRAAACS